MGLSQAGALPPALTRLLALHAGRQQVRLPQADVVQVGAQALHRQHLVPLLRLQLCKARGSSGFSPGPAKRGRMSSAQPGPRGAPIPESQVKVRAESSVKTMATACLLVSLGRRVMHLTLLISVTWGGERGGSVTGGCVHAWLRPPVGPLHAPARLGHGPSPWGSPANTLTSHLGTSPGAGALCWRICGRPASTAGRSVDRKHPERGSAPHSTAASGCPPLQC